MRTPCLKLNLTTVCLCLISLALLAAPNASEREAQLIGVLKSNASQKEKADACRELARVGTRDSVAALAALLPDEALSHMARYGLETIPGSAVDDVFRNSLKTLNGRPLVGVIGSVGVRRDAKAVPALSKLLSSAEPEVAQAAARALGKIGDKASTDALLKAVASVPEQSLPAFAEGLLRCAERLAGAGQKDAALQVYDELRKLKSPHQVRTAAFRGAVLLREKKGLPLITEALRSEDYSTFALAVRISREIPEKWMSETLSDTLPALKDADRKVLLLQAMGQRSDPGGLAAIVNAAGQGEKPVRLAAVRALSQLSSPRSIPDFLRLMTDADSDVAQAAKEGLAAIPGKEVDAAVEELLNDKTPAACIRGMDLASRRRMVAAIPRLFALAEGEDASLRIAARRRLGDLASPADITKLADLLVASKGPEEIEASENALASVFARAESPESRVAELKSRLAGVDPLHKAALLRIIAAQGGPDALASLREALKDANPEIRTEVIRGLGKWNSVDAAPVLLDLARTSSSATDKALSLRGYLALAGRGDVKPQERLQMCRDAAPLVSKDEEKRMFLGILGGLNAPEALRLIEPLLSDTAVAGDAATAAVNVSEKLLSRKNAPGNTTVVKRVLEKAVANPASEDCAKRARKLLETL